MGGNRPPSKESELFKHYRHLASQPKEVLQAPQYILIYDEAKAKKHWIFDPVINGWLTPEQFLELEQKISGGETDRLSRLQIKDPLEGIEAGYMQMQQLKERMEIFVKRVVEYYRTPKCS